MSRIPQICSKTCFYMKSNEYAFIPNYFLEGGGILGSGLMYLLFF